jgi:1,4-dihydroxy-2-naphthoate octaprenyltransferase
MNVASFLIALLFACFAIFACSYWGVIPERIVPVEIGFFIYGALLLVSLMVGVLTTRTATNVWIVGALCALATLVYLLAPFFSRELPLGDREVVSGWYGLFLGAVIVVYIVGVGARLIWKHSVAGRS